MWRSRSVMRVSVPLLKCSVPHLELRPGRTFSRGKGSLLVKPERALPLEMRTLLLLSLLGTVLSAQPVLDGEIGEAEWYKAAKHAMTNGAILRLLSAGDVLYLSAQLPTSAWGHIYVFDGDAIQVLHVSAAIGRLRYRRKGEEW